jgi:DNA-binding FadR family transcriptional regulator
MHQTRLYERVCGKLEEAMRVGALRPGDRLPSVRRLSEREQEALQLQRRAVRMIARGRDEESKSAASKRLVEFETGCKQSAR